MSFSIPEFGWDYNSQEIASLSMDELTLEAR